MIVQRFNLNLIPNQSPVVVHVNQYDTGTGRLIATLYEGNEPYSPNGTAVIQGTKPDGHGFQYTATLDGNVVTADLTEQMSPVAGDVRAQIVVTESSGVTGTFVFIMRVQPSALPSDADMSESDYPLIEEAIREAQEAVERAQEAITETQENAENSEAWAQGTRGGIPVGPTDPTYEHNAEYWAQYAERYAQGGLHYKASIPFADIPTTGMREGDMYDITDDFTTDSRFTEGAGIKVKGGTNIAWNSDNKWDILALPYIPKTTFNGRSGAILPMAGDYDSKKILLSSALHIGGKTQDNVQKALEALEGNKADKVDNAVADNFAGLDANGNLKDSGKNAGDFATPSDIAGQQSLLKDTVGWTGKNRAYSQTNNAVVAHIENGITYDVSWTDPATVTLKKNSASGATITSGSTSPLSFTADADYELYFGSSATVTNIMVKDSRITDPTYEPYHESVEVMYEEEIHGVNLFSNSISGLATSGWAVGATNFSLAEGATAFYGKVQRNKNYTITKAGGDRFRVCLSNEVPAHRVPCNIIANADGNSYTFNSGNYDYVYLLASMTSQTIDVIKPMLRKADIEDNTYRPYNNQAIQNQLNAQGMLGAKNWLPNIVTNQTKNGITWTKNSDGTLTANGTATAASEVAVVSPNTYDTAGLLQSGQKYIYSIGIPRNMLSTYGIEAYGDFRNDTDTGWEDDLPIDTPFNGKPNKVGFYIRVKNGVTVNNLVFKPMVRLASDPDDTYQPYAMTNRELTEKKIDAELTFVRGVSVDTLTENKRYYCSGGMTGLPTGNIGYLDVHRSPNREGIHQTFYPAGTQGEIYVRRYWDNAWGSWYKFTGTVVS